MIFNIAQEPEENFEKVVEDFYKKAKRLNNFDQKKYLILEINAKTLDKEEANLPRIKYLISS